ncbi:hypothetical protein M153_1990002953 [Pseudoloma neurophilia]|uniref:Uncharacterized protein n=1 Tax=Pseudoloma neurophilia TaxID=146866 RepID=A0A0R0M689_9MICR|nr:hypothetical protein M153_1990002953 [Pseudoloma neurophilia]
MRICAQILTTQKLRGRHSKRIRIERFEDGPRWDLHHSVSEGVVKKLNL